MSIKHTFLAVLLALISFTKAIQLETLQEDQSLFDTVNDIFTFTEDTPLDDDGSADGNGDPFGMGGFFTSLVMIPFAIVLLWKNEKKLVTYQKCMARAAKECLTVNPKELNEMNNFKLVHMAGKTTNQVNIVDQEFNVSVEQSYRLKRKVEMYQWQETVRHETRQDGNGRRYQHTTYTYTKVWSSQPISSANFHKQGYENPAKTWPFTSKTNEAQNITLGELRLNQSQTSRLGSSYTTTYEVSDAQVKQTSSQMKNNGFSEFEVRGNYLYASTSDNSRKAEHIGQYRVRFEYDKCGQTTMIAQQVQDDDDMFTLRKWNPYKTHVPYGESTDAEADSTIGNIFCCYICAAVNCCCNSIFEEVVDYARDGTETSERYFKEQENMISSSASCIRVLGIVLTIFGIYLLFSPIIALLKWIPLVGWLLGGLVSVAAFIFALLVGTIISTFVIAVAWVFFRPLIGIPLLIGAGVGSYFTFYYDWGQEAAVE